MSNCLLAFDNLVDAGVLSGGSWLAGLPLANLQNEVQGVVARTTDDATGSTKFSVTLPTDRISRLIALVNHNLSLQALVRVRASDTSSTMASGVLFDSGWQEAWPAVYDSETLEWEQPNYWSGQYTNDERLGYTWNFIKYAPASILARYWLIEIDDINNTDGYVQIGRLFIGDAWQTSINMQYGAGIRWEDPSNIEEAISGTEYADRRMMYRVATFTITGLGENEAYSRAFDMMRRVGVTREVIFVYDPDDTLHALRRQYRGRLRQLSQVENPTLDVFSTAFEIKEKL